MARPLNQILQKLIVFFLVLFCLVFPKAGFKIGDIPITFGYILFASVVFMVLLRNWQRPLRLADRNRLMIVLLALPFAIYGLFVFYFLGYQETGFVISFFVNFLLFPISFMYILSIQIDRLDMEYLLSLIKHGVLLISIYGIFLYVYKNATGNFIEIPYLTVNSGDLGALESKNIARGDSYKLISTYNNGNIFGVCVLMLLPLFDFLEVNFLKRLIVRTALVLTLSRTVWIGIILYDAARLIFSKRRGVSLILSSLAYVFISVCAILYLLGVLGYSSDFILDKSLGGRADSLNFELRLIPDKPFSSISEIVYASVLDSFGVIGFFLFIIFFLSPIFIYFFTFNKKRLNPYKNKIISGIFIYIVLCFSDGAMMLIPTMLIYWFLVALFLTKNIHFIGNESNVRFR